jgi:hypothetical protein
MSNLESRKSHAFCSEVYITKQVLHADQICSQTCHIVFFLPSSMRSNQQILPSLKFRPQVLDSAKKYVQEPLSAV